MKGKIFARIVLAVGALLLLYQFVFYAQEAVRMKGWLASGGNQTELHGAADSLLVFEDIHPEEFDGPVPAEGDTLIAVVTAAGDSLAAAAIRAYIAEPGERVQVIYRHEGETLSTGFLFGEHRKVEIAFIFALQITRFLITLGFLLVGLWALNARPDLPGVRALALFSFSMSALMVGGVQLGMGRFPTFDIPGARIVDQVLRVLIGAFGAFWLNLQLYFPSALRWVRRRPLLVHLLLYLPQIVMLLDGILDLGIPNLAVTIAITAQISLGFGVLVYRLRGTREPLARRQLSLVIWGSGIGLGMLFILMVISAFGLMQRLPGLVAISLIQLGFLALLLSPISFAYAFGRYRLLEVEGHLRRGTRYVLVTGVLLALFFGLLYVTSNLLLGGLNLEGRSPTLAVALILALGVTPLHRRAQSAFAERLYPERNRLRGILSEFHARAATLADRGSLFEKLEESLSAGLGIRALVPAMREEDGGFHLPGDEPLPLENRGQLMRHLLQRREPVLMDELRASGRIVLSDAEESWLAQRHIGVILPLGLRSDLLGLLFLVCDRHWDGLSVAGLEELRALGGQVALECENLRLIEETLDKRRMAEQLDMARKVQEGFLPQSLPETPGLELAATYRSSLEVAGDYYDVVALPEGRTLLAVGDVSGKGAGAAMIMANLQASLRSMARVGVPLGEMVGGINDIIHANTPVEQFITFFAASYEPVTRTLTFVNAGHNPPRIVHTDGSDSDLDPVGPILGVFPGLTFEAKTVTLAPGDLLVAFTDGVSEAMNMADEDFGEDRIVAAVLPSREDPPERLLDVIEAAVDAFRGERDLFDDYTLLLARVTAGD